MTSVKRMDSASTTSATQVTPSEPSSGIGPRPAFPAQTPAVKHLTHDLPTAPYRPAALTRAQLDREIAAAQLHEPYLIGYGGIQATAAF